MSWPSTLTSVLRFAIISVIIHFPVWKSLPSDHWCYFVFSNLIITKFYFCKRNLDATWLPYLDLWHSVLSFNQHHQSLWEIDHFNLVQLLPPPASQALLLNSFYLNCVLIKKFAYLPTQIILAALTTNIVNNVVSLHLVQRINVLLEC